MIYQQERQTAIQAVLKACQLCQNVQKALVSEDSIAKKDKSPVTIADYGSQAVVNAMLLEAFPNDPIVGEEDSQSLRQPDQAELKQKMVDQVHTVFPAMSEEAILQAIDAGNYEGGPSGRHWTLDPIDGTKGFLRGEQYAVALALIENGEVVFGVLGCPNLPLDLSDDSKTGCLFIAAKGQGAVMRALDSDTETPVSVSDVQDVTAARFCESVESGHSKHDDSAQIAEQLGIKTDPVRIDSQCKYAIMARGDAAVYLRLPTRADYEEKIWDHAAGWIVMKEAGGEVTDIHGQQLDFSIGRTLKNNKGVVGTNGPIHQEVLKAVQNVLGV